VTSYLRLLIMSGIAGALFLGLAPDAALAEKRVALIVGNSAYQNVARLPNPEKDATAMAKLFRDAGFDAIVAENNVGNLDFKRAVRNFEDATIDSDIAVVYYAGHGIEIGGVNYLVPVDAKLASDRDAQDEAILLERLVESVDGAKRLRLIILDACRDDPFVAAMKRVRRRTATRAISSGLSKVEPAGTDTLIAYAAKAGSTAEDGDGEHSPFTTALLANLTTPGLDVRLAFGRVRDQVMKITNSRQEPFVYGSIGGENISLVPAPAKPKEPDIANVKTDYELVAQIGTKKAWEVFLGTYKTGFYADLARAQLAKLGESGIPTASAAPPKAVASLEPPAPPEPVKPTSDELRAWNKLRDTSDKDALEKFISRYPNSPLALNAKNRLDVLERAAREREEKARVEREASQQHAEDERRAKEAARIAAQQRAEDERRAKEAARIAALQAETDRRAKELAESEKQKKEQTARIASQQHAEDERRANEAARIAEQQAENERRAKQIAEAEMQKKEQAARIAAQQRVEDERRTKEATRIAALQAETDRRAKESEKQKLELACQNEQSRLDDLNAAGNSTSVRNDLKRLLQDLTCDRLRPQVVASLNTVTSELDKSATPPPPSANTPELVASAQKELARLGCYSGDSDGKLDAATKGAIKKYQARREQPVTDIAVTDSFVRELGKLKLRVCPAAIVDKPKRNDNRKEAKHERSNSSRSESRPQASQQARPQASQQARPQASQQASGGGHSTMIGVGF
jgi:Caspase domain/Putative peptidoglycan binding domain